MTSELQAPSLGAASPPVLALELQSLTPVEVRALGATVREWDFPQLGTRPESVTAERLNQIRELSGIESSRRASLRTPISAAFGSFAEPPTLASFTKSLVRSATFSEGCGSRAAAETGGAAQPLPPAAATFGALPLAAQQPLYPVSEGTAESPPATPPRRTAGAPSSARSSGDASSAMRGSPVAAQPVERRLLDSLSADARALERLTAASAAAGGSPQQPSSPSALPLLPGARPPPSPAAWQRSAASLSSSRLPRTQRWLAPAQRSPVAVPRSGPSSNVGSPPGLRAENSREALQRQMVSACDAVLNVACLLVAHRPVCVGGASCNMPKKAVHVLWVPCDLLCKPLQSTPTCSILAMKPAVLIKLLPQSWGATFCAADVLSVLAQPTPRCKRTRQPSWPPRPGRHSTSRHRAARRHLRRRPPRR